MRILQVARGLSPRDRRALKTGLLILVPALSYPAFVRPYLSAVRRTRDLLQSQRVLLLREEEVIHDARAIQVEFAAVRAAARRVLARTYSGADSAVAMRALGRDATASLKEAGLVVQRIEMRDSVSRGAALQELTIELRAQGDFESMLAALARLESHTRLIRVARLVIEKSGEHESSGAESLALVATIHGYSQ